MKKLYFILLFFMCLKSNDHPFSSGFWYTSPSAPDISDDEEEEYFFPIENSLFLSSISLMGELKKEIPDESRLKFLVEKVQDLSLTDSDSNNFLHLSIRRRLSNISKRLLEKGCDVNHKNWELDTPLTLSIKFNLVDLAYRILHNQANVNIFNKYYETPFTLATTLGNIDLARQIWLYGGDANYFKINPLLRSIIKNNKAFTMFLINTIGVNINIKNSKGYTPLMLAVLKDDYALVKLLLKKGALINIQAEDGQTALTLSKKLPKSSKARELLSSRFKRKIC